MHGFFPKDEHYNVGIGNLISKKSTKKLSKKDLYEFVHQHFLKLIVLKILLPFLLEQKVKIIKAASNIFLVGDAAGFAESLLGEGIYNAIVSGKYAAR